MKSKTKKLSNTSAFSMSWIAKLPICFQRGPTFSSLPFITNIVNSIVQSTKSFLTLFFLLIPSNVYSAPTCLSAVPILICTDKSFWRGGGTLAASDVILSSKNALTKSLLLNSFLVKSEDKRYSKGLELVERRKDQEDASTLQCRDSFVIN